MIIINKNNNNKNSSWVKEGDGKRFMDIEFQVETEHITVGHIEAYSFCARREASPSA